MKIFTEEYEKLIWFTKWKLSTWKVTQSPEDIVHEAYVKLKKMEQKSKCGKLTLRYIKKTIVSHITDIWRKEKDKSKGEIMEREGDLEEILNQESQSPDNDKQNYKEKLKNRLEALRRHLDIIDEQFRLSKGKRKTDFYAVIYFQILTSIRYRISEAIRENQIDEEVITKIFPIRKEDLNRRFNPHSPTISEILNCVKNNPALDSNKKSPNIAELVYSTTRELTNGENVISPGQWYQWVLRAKKAGKQAVGDETWGKYFNSFFIEKKKSNEVISEKNKRSKKHK